MKLYTEERVRGIINLSRESYGYDGYKFDEDEILKQLTPIELPSDEEIKKESHNHYIKGQLNIEPASDTEYAFKKGAKWMKEQILNQNK